MDVPPPILSAIFMVVQTAPARISFRSAGLFHRKILARKAERSLVLAAGGELPIRA